MASLSPSIKFHALDASGNPAAGWRVYSYEAGTTTPKATYTTSAASVANPNPVVLDSRGEATIWLSGTYKIRLTTGADALVWEDDNVSDGTTNGTFTNATFAGTLTVSSTSVTWSGNPTHSGNHTFTGNVSINGNTTLGNASGDTLTVNPNAVTWANNPTHSGNHTWSGTQTFSVAPVFPTNYPGTFRAAVKSATTSRASTTIRSDDPHLTVSLTAGQWKFDVLVPVWSTTSTTGGMTVNMGFSGTATADYYSVIHATTVLNPANSGPLTLLATGYNVSAACVVATSVNGANWLRVFGYLNASTSGTLAFRWAQSVSDVNATNVGIGGHMTAELLA